MSEIHIDEGPGSRRPTAAALLAGPESVVPLLVGIAVSASGFVLLFGGWIKVAALPQVGQQIPDVLSAGFTGLGLIMSGLALMSMAIKNRQAAEGARQFEAINDNLRALRVILEQFDPAR